MGNIKTYKKLNTPKQFVEIAKNMQAAVDISNYLAENNFTYKDAAEVAEMIKSEATLYKCNPDIKPNDLYVPLNKCDCAQALIEDTITVWKQMGVIE